MTDEPVRPTAPEPDRSVPSTKVDLADPSPKRDLLPILYLLGFVVLAGSVFYLWQNPSESPVVTQQADRVDTLQAQIAALRDQVAKLSDQKPTGPSAADFTKLQQQVGALDSRPAVAPATVQQLSDKLNALDGRKTVTPEQLSALSDQVQALGRQIPDTSSLTQRLTALEQRPAYDPAAVNGKFTDLASKLQQVQDADAKTAARVDGVEKLANGQADQLKALTQKAQITARLQGMAAALAAGQKLGDIPGAPPALSRFANEAPPTEASLRESFDHYADAAQKASQPAITANQDFGSRLWTRAQQAVTVRQGDRVLVGDPIAGVMAHAREKLDNGDLAGSVAALKGLAGPAAAAMKPWTDKAESLVAARSAIASLAAN